MWLHERFWHAPLSRLLPFLRAAGVPAERLAPASLKEILKLCARCSEYAPPLDRPATRCTLTSRFNERVQADVFHLNGQRYLLMVDECFKYKSAVPVASEDVPTLASAVYQGWIRTFWPMRYFICDQFSSFAGVSFGVCLDKWNVERVLGGAETERAGNTHKDGLG